MGDIGKPDRIEATPVLAQVGVWVDKIFRVLVGFLRPQSLLVLVLFGFLLVAMPLIFAVMSGALSMGRLAGKSEKVVYQAVKTTQSSRMLMEQLVDMERSARQYQVLEDPELLDVFTQTHNKFTETIQDILALSDNINIRRKVQELTAKEQELYDNLTRRESILKMGQNIHHDFAHLNELASTLWEESIRVVGKEVDNLDKAAHFAQQRMLRQTILLVPTTLVLVVIFTYLIARPIRQLDAAIRRLGAGHFDNPIMVSGPRDLEDLGKRLDWLRKRLVQLEDEKQGFLRNVSHEFKTPLATVREGSELLVDEIVGKLSAEQREVVELLRSGSIQLQRLIENLLDYQRIASQSIALNLGVSDLNRTITSVLSDQKILMMSKGLILDARLQKNVSIRADEEKVKSIISNLFSNAIKYSPHGGTVTVTLSQREATARLEVCDEGPGIAMSEREQIFDMFYQGHEEPAWNIRGTGLGLAIVREYVLAHHGSVQVIEQKHGRSGAGFRVDLPLYIGREDT